MSYRNDQEPSRLDGLHEFNLSKCRRDEGVEAIIQAEAELGPKSTGVSPPGL
ncbi:hypothetical protein [Streptomyces sp. NPDC002172]